MKPEQAILYFLSGTGNSYRVAAWLHERFLGSGTESRLMPIDAADPASEIEASLGTVMVLAFPTHGLMPPWSMIKFIMRLPRKKGVSLFCMPTRGCFHIGPVPIPGGAGLASFIPHLILLFKGYRPRGSLSLDMPLNIISVHPPLTAGGVERILGRARPKVDRAADRLLAGRTLWLSRNNLWELLWAIVPLVYLPFYPLAYLMMGKFFMGKLMFAGSTCTGCALCARSCPSGAIDMTGSPARPFWSYRCEACLRCLNICPHRSVEAGVVWGAILIGISAVPVERYILNMVAPAGTLPGFTGDYLFQQILNIIFFFPAVVIAYRVFSAALRLRAINAFFSATSLSHYYGRYHEPSTRLGDLGGNKDIRK
jgi:ferredoxin